MSNYNNIKPYNEFNHLAATHGGVAKFLDDLKKANYNRGRIDERESLIWEIPLVVIAGIGLWETGKSCIRKIKKNHQAKQEAINWEIKKAEEAALEEINASYDENSAFSSADKRLFNLTRTSSRVKRNIFLE